MVFRAARSAWCAAMNLAGCNLPTDEQQCQGGRENSNKKARRLAKGAGLFLFRADFAPP